MAALLLFSTTEHLLVLSAFLFPPVLIIVLLVILLTTFGKSLGLRERYVSILIRIFEWGAGEIQSSQNDTKKMSFELGAYDCEDDEYGLLEHSDAGHYCSLDLSSTQSPTDSGFMPDSPLARSANSLSSLRKCSSLARNGSSTSLCSASSGRMRHSSGQSIIIRETAIHLDEDEYTEKTMVNSRGWQVIRDSIYFMKAAVETIIEDEVTSRFQAEQLASWNMLTRTSVNFYQFVNWKLTMLWVLGFLFRYFFLLPMRLIVFSVSIITVVFGTAVIGLFPNGRLKSWMNEKLMLVCMRIASRAFSALIFFHDTAILVANHTSPIDVMILGTDAVYALIGQSHSGFLGAIQRALSRACSHIWFERSEAKDRSLVARSFPIKHFKLITITFVFTFLFANVTANETATNDTPHIIKNFVTTRSLTSEIDKLDNKIDGLNSKLDNFFYIIVGMVVAILAAILAIALGQCNPCSCCRPPPKQPNNENRPTQSTAPFSCVNYFASGNDANLEKGVRNNNLHNGNNCDNFLNAMLAVDSNPNKNGTKVGTSASTKSTTGGDPSKIHLLQKSLGMFRKESTTLNKNEMEMPTFK